MSMMEVRKKTRTSGIELLRILAMIMIVAHHFATHVQWEQISSINHYWITILGSFGRIGVGIFFIITGYFLARQKDYNWRKIFNTIRPTWFYSLMFLAIFLILGDNKITFSFPLNAYVEKSVFPILSNAYWFISSYVIVSLLSPYIKKGLDALENRELIKILIILFICGFCAKLFNLSIANSTALIMEIPVGIFYVIVGYTIYRYREDINSIAWSIVGILLSLAMIAFAPVIIHFGLAFGYNIPSDLFTEVYAPATIIFSICVFIVFSRLNFSSKVINYIASLTFGIYLIHENLFVGYTLWNTNNIFSITSHANDGLFSLILYSLAVVMIVFIACGLIEAARKVSVRVISYICNIEQRNKIKEEAK